MFFKRGSLVTAERVTLADWRKLIIASSIRQDPESINEPVAFDFDTDNFVYARVRAVSAGEYWGPNGNGDWFGEGELQRSHKSFIHRGNYLDHKSDSVDGAVGIILDSRYLQGEGTHYVQCLLAVDKAQSIADKVAKGIATDVSMGALVQECNCSICGKMATCEAEYCDHLMNHMGREYQGRKVYAINKGVNFYELSWVTVGADKDAKLLEVLAKQKENFSPKLLSIAEAYAKSIQADEEKKPFPPKEDKKEPEKSEKKEPKEEKKEAPKPPFEKKDKEPASLEKTVQQVIKKEVEKKMEEELVKKVRDALNTMNTNQALKNEITDEEIASAVRRELESQVGPVENQAPPPPKQQGKPPVPPQQKAPEQPAAPSIMSALHQRVRSAISKLDDEKVSMEIDSKYSVVEVGKVAGNRTVELFKDGQPTGLYTVRHADNEKDVKAYYQEKFLINEPNIETEAELQTTINQESDVNNWTIRYVPGKTLDKSAFVARKGNLQVVQYVPNLLSEDLQRQIVATEKKKADIKTEYGVGEYDITKGKVDEKIQEGGSPAQPSKAISLPKVEEGVGEYDATKGKVDVDVKEGGEPIQPSQAISKYASYIEAKVVKMAEDQNTEVVEAILEGGSIAKLAQIWHTRPTLVKAQTTTATKKEAKITGTPGGWAKETTEPIQQDPKNTKDMLARQTPTMEDAGPKGSRGSEIVKFFSQYDKADLATGGENNWARKVAALTAQLTQIQAENKVLKSTLENTKKAHLDQKRSALIDAIMDRMVATGALEPDANEILEWKDKGLEHEEAIAKASKMAEDRQRKQLASLDLASLESVGDVINKYAQKPRTVETETKSGFVNIPLVRVEASQHRSPEDLLSDSWDTK